MASRALRSSSRSRRTPRDFLSIRLILFLVRFHRVLHLHFVLGHGALAGFFRFHFFLRHCILAFFHHAFVLHHVLFHHAFLVLHHVLLSGWHDPGQHERAPDQNSGDPRNGFSFHSYTPFPSAMS